MINHRLVRRHGELVAIFCNEKGRYCYGALSYGPIKQVRRRAIQSTARKLDVGVPTFINRPYHHVQRAIDMNVWRSRKWPVRTKLEGSSIWPEDIV